MHCRYQRTRCEGGVPDESPIDGSDSEDESDAPPRKRRRQDTNDDTPTPRKGHSQQGKGKEREVEPEAGPSAPAARGQVSVARWREDAVLTDRQVLDRLLQEVQRTRRNNAEFAKAQERMEQRLLDAEDRLAAALRVMERWEQGAAATLDRLRALERRLRPEGETESGSEDAPTGGPAEESAEESEMGPEDWEDDEDDPYVPSEEQEEGSAEMSEEREVA